MRSQSLASRLENVEKRVVSLEELPSRLERVELQIVQLREEMHDGFFALREEIRGGDEEVRRSLREEIRAGDEETRRVLREEIRAGDEETRRVLREEIRAAFEALSTQMRVLHEDVIARIALIQEARSPARPAPKRRRSR